MVYGFQRSQSKFSGRYLNQWWHIMNQGKWMKKKSRGGLQWSFWRSWKLLKCFLVFVAILTDSPLCSPSLEGVCSLERVSTFVSLCHNASSIPLKHPSWPRPSRHNCLINAPVMPGINAAILARQLGWRPGLMLLWNRNWRNNTEQLIIKQISMRIFKVLADFRYFADGKIPEIS